MRYIYTDQSGVFQFDRYFAYLQTIRDELGEQIYAFAADRGRYCLDTPGTLHDSWLAILFLTLHPAEKSASKSVSIELLGPFHDRNIIFSYLDVVSVDIRFDFSNANSQVDLLVHEFRISNGVIEHECQFDGGRHLTIGCKRIECVEKLI